MQDPAISQLAPSGGAVYHAAWPVGKIEPNRRIYDYELVYFARGAGVVGTPERRFSCGPGNVIVIPPGLEHYTATLAALERWCVHFDWFGDCRAPRGASEVFVFSGGGRDFHAGLCARPPELPGVRFPWFVETVPPEFPERLRAYFRVAAAPGPGGELRRRGLLLELLGMLLEAGSGASGPAAEAPAGAAGWLLLRSKGFLDRHYTDPGLTVAATAAQFRVTPGHLTRIFRAGLGMTVLGYLQELRLEHCRRLLRRGDLTVREIAYAGGFSDPNYFIRLFRSRQGMTPGAYRRISCKNSGPPL